MCSGLAVAVQRLFGGLVCWFVSVIRDTGWCEYVFDVYREVVSLKS